MNEIPKCPNYVAHPQAVWFEEHWLPIIEKLKVEKEELMQNWADDKLQLALKYSQRCDEIVEMKKNIHKLTHQVEILKKALEFVSICGHDDDCLFINSKDESSPEFECECYCGPAREALKECEGVK